MAALLLGLAAAPALADEVENPAIEAVIGDQIAALRADDFAKAFSFASPMIQEMFGTPENFGEMVKQGYPMVWHPSGVKYLALRDVAGGLWQRIMVTDAGGRVWMLDYRMVQVDGAWRIDGVQILPAQGVGA
ncbi:MAG: DUF4864 domain-containing protein [Rhodobacteraceae bacterium]|nr:DUF4864 domain-containing protein [Paracoccaceae bacterium]